MADFTLEPRGPFTLASAARFIAGWPPAPEQGSSAAELRLRFLVDDWSGPATVTLRQDGAVLRGTVEAEHPERAIAQAARILSLDHDGTGYPEVGERDAVIEARQRETGYLRPVLFHSPYEAAAWSIISARTNHAQAARLRDALGETFPAPAELLALEELKGLPAAKVPRLHGIAEAALEGRLDREPLLAAAPDEALARLQELSGIGPFYAALILLRAVGTTDVLATDEPRLKERVKEVYGRPLEDVSGGWRPFRTWCSVLMRAGG